MIINDRWMISDDELVMMNDDEYEDEWNEW